MPFQRSIDPVSSNERSRGFHLSYQESTYHRLYFLYRIFISDDRMCAAIEMKAYGIYMN